MKISRASEVLKIFIVAFTKHCLGRCTGAAEFFLQISITLFLGYLFAFGSILTSSEVRFNYR